MGVAAKLTTDWDDLIQDICLLLKKETGNVLDEKQRPMVESRMKKRMLELGIQDPKAYRQFWAENRTQENRHLIGLLTTHFTSFFREFSHFEWLAKELPDMVEVARREKRKTLRFWSSACSKGQEVWSLCMWLRIHLAKIDPGMDWVVYGSDIDETSLEEAENAVYHRRELETAPRDLWEGCWSRGTGEIRDWYRAHQELRKRTKFVRLNLLDLKLPKSECFDAIFCRNVLIYFDRSNQEKAVHALLGYLHPAGVLITGMSESLNGLGLPIKGVAPSVYRHSHAVSQNIPSPKPATKQEAQKVRVLCVDDSPTVLSILKKVLAQSDFQVIGTAANGQEALEQVKKLNPDVITLDLHMPVMDGMAFLKNSRITKNIPVVIVSSVSRDDSALVSSLFTLGVSDFIEKPTLNDMEKTGEELRQKLKLARTQVAVPAKYKAEKQAEDPGPSRPGHIVFNFNSGDLDQVIHVLSSRVWEQDEITFLASNALDAKSLKSQLSTYLPKSKLARFLSPGDELLDRSSLTIWLHFAGGNKELTFGLKKKNHFLIVEESTSGSTFRNWGDDVTPFTSFAYNLEKILGDK